MELAATATSRQYHATVNYDSTRLLSISTVPAYCRDGVSCASNYHTVQGDCQFRQYQTTADFDSTRLLSISTVLGYCRFRQYQATVDFDSTRLLSRWS